MITDVDIETLALQVKRSENLPVLPQVAGTVLKMADDPRTSAKDMERTIEKDMALATKILKVANSPYYGVTNVSSIAKAVSILGMNTVRSLVVSIAYQQMVSGQLKSKKFQRTQFWVHSLAVGTASRIVAKMILPSKAEELYLAGLMHDVGMLVLERFLPEMFDEAIQKAENLQISFQKAETAVFGYDHSTVGGLLIERWGLSQTIANGVKYHHDVAGDTTTQQTTAIVAIANSLAKQFDFYNQDSGSPYRDEFAESVAGISAEQLKIIGAVMSQEVLKAQQAFQIQAAA